MRHRRSTRCRGRGCALRARGLPHLPGPPRAQVTPSEPAVWRPLPYHLLDAKVPRLGRVAARASCSRRCCVGLPQDDRPGCRGQGDQSESKYAHPRRRQLPRSASFARSAPMSRFVPRAVGTIARSRPICDEEGSVAVLSRRSEVPLILKVHVLCRIAVPATYLRGAESSRRARAPADHSGPMRLSAIGSLRRQSTAQPNPARIERVVEVLRRRERVIPHPPRRGCHTPLYGFCRKPRVLNRALRDQ